MRNRKNALSDYVRSLYGIKPLTREEERNLATLIEQGDELAVDKLVTHNLRFVVTTIKNTPTWYHSGVDMEDLLGFGNEALLMAAKKWKPQGNIRFISYARKVILTEVNRGVANTKNIIRLPVNITEELRRIKYNERILSQQLGREPSNKELAEKIGIDVERIDRINSILNKEPISLEAFETDHLKEDGYDN